MSYTKEERKEYDRLRYQKNKEKITEQTKLYRQNHKEERKEYDKLRYENDKEKMLEYSKVYYEKNKEKLNEYRKEYNKEYRKTPEGIKVRRTSNWKSFGLIHDDIHELYERYLQATHCEECQIEFINDKGPKQRCMDHCHETGLFRNFLCNSCNIKRR